MAIHPVMSVDGNAVLGCFIQRHLLVCSHQLKLRELEATSEITSSGQGKENWSTSRTGVDSHLIVIAQSYSAISEITSSGQGKENWSTSRTGLTVTL